MRYLLFFERTQDCFANSSPSCFFSSSEFPLIKESGEFNQRELGRVLVFPMHHQVTHDVVTFYASHKTSKWPPPPFVKLFCPSLILLQYITCSSIARPVGLRPAPSFLPSFLPSFEFFLLFFFPIAASFLMQDFLHSQRSRSVRPRTRKRHLQATKQTDAKQSRTGRKEEANTVQCKEESSCMSLQSVYEFQKHAVRRIVSKCFGTHSIQNQPTQSKAKRTHTHTLTHKRSTHSHECRRTSSSGQASMQAGGQISRKNFGPADLNRICSYPVPDWTACCLRQSLIPFETDQLPV